MSTRSSTSSKSTASLSCEALQVDLVDMVDLVDALADGNSLPETPHRINGGGKPARSLELRGHGRAQPHFPLPLGEGCRVRGPDADPQCHQIERLFRLRYAHAGAARCSAPSRR